MEARKLRGAAIVEAGGLRQRAPDLWLVPAASHSGSWVVDYFDPDSPTCTCPDFAQRWAFCKHIFAIEIHEKRLSILKPTPPAGATYTQDWSGYNAAQTNERDHFVQLLHGLCQGITMPPAGRGRPRTPLADVVFSCALKVYEGTSGRRASSDLRTCHEQGLTTKLVSYNTISDYMKDPSLTPLLRMLVQESAAPLAGIESHIAVDATGFSTRVYDRYYDHKWGKKRRKASFVKAHAACGALTHVCTDLLVNGKGDATQLAPLLEGTSLRFDFDEVSADKAYSSKANHQVVADLGAVPYIPFKHGTVGKTGPAMWRKMFHYFQYKRAEFSARYHQRSQVETMFSMVKAKFGGSVRSKLETAQVNEVHFKFLCHNIVVLVGAIYMHDLVPEFWTDELTTEEVI